MTPEEELVEAAVLLAHVEEREMPEALERKILAQSRAIASEVRFTTTKSAAVAVESLPASPGPRPSLLRTWGGWLAAAACFAMAVYAWRRQTLEHEHAMRVAAASAASVVLTDGRKQRVARVRPDVDGGRAELVIDALPPHGPDEEYRLWISGDDAAAAKAVGAVTCAGGCEGRVLTLPRASGGIRSAWLTLERRGEPAVTPAAPRVVAEGHGPP